MHSLTCLSSIQVLGNFSMISTANFLNFLSKDRRIRLGLITQKYSSHAYIHISSQLSFWSIKGIHGSYWPVNGAHGPEWFLHPMPNSTSPFWAPWGIIRSWALEQVNFSFNTVLSASCMATVRKYMFSPTQKVSNIYFNQHSLSLTISCCEFNHLEWTQCSEECLNLNHSTDISTSSMTAGKIISPPAMLVPLIWPKTQ